MSDAASGNEPATPGPRLLAGGPIAAEIRAGVKAGVERFTERRGRAPVLAVVVVGDDPASAVYAGQIVKACGNAGIEGRRVDIAGDVTPERLRAEIAALNADPVVAGIIVQMPLPKQIPLRTVAEAIDPAKDIDGISPQSAGLLALGYDGFLPATAEASIEILKRSGIDPKRKRAVVVGRSNVVGKPAAILLLRDDATVTICHSRTPDLAAHLREAEIVIVAIGKAELITGEMLRPGSVVVDVGINVVGEKLVGDVHFESAARVVSAITPVPGGVGPVTNALLLAHLLRAAEQQAETAELGAGAVEPAGRPG